MLTYVLAVLAAAANALSWVLQRKANREIAGESLSLRLMRDLIKKPVWLGGIAAITAGFVLQAAALGTGALAVVEPILVLELPLTLLLAAWTFRSPIGRREWVPSVVLAVAVGVLLFLLSPTAGRPEAAGWLLWVLAICANGGLVLFLVGWTWTGSVRLRARPRGAPGSRQTALTGAQQAALLGIAAGSAFGLTAALMKGMADTFASGLGALLSSWQLYAMVVAGAAGVFLTQSALNAGRLTASQPGISLMDPIISVLWGILVFREEVRGGWLILPQVISLLVIAAAAALLARSPLLASR